MQVVVTDLKAIKYTRDVNIIMSTKLEDTNEW